MFNKKATTVSGLFSGFAGQLMTIASAQRKVIDQKDMEIASLEAERGEALREENLAKKLLEKLEEFASV